MSLASQGGTPPNWRGNSPYAVFREGYCTGVSVDVLSDQEDSVAEPAEKVMVFLRKMS
jgi:hypothetical protein